jgi:hypothetical protein
MVSDKALAEYKAIYKKQFGEDLSDQEALEQATKLLTLMKAVYRPIKKSDYEDYLKRVGETEKE